MLSDTLLRTVQSVRGLSGRHNIRRVTALARLLLCVFILNGWSISHRSRAMKKVPGLLRWFSLQPHACMRAVKAECHRLREFAVSGIPLKPTHSCLIPNGVNFTKKTAYQLSCIGRALPCPDRDILDQSLRDWAEVVLVKPESKVVEEFKGFPLNSPIPYKIQERLSKIRKGPPIVPHSSASYQCPRSANGALNEFAVDASGSSVIDPIPENLSVFARGMRNKQYKMAAASFAKKKHHGLMKPVAIGERGYKSRVVTKHDPKLIAKAHGERTRLWRVLSKIRQIRRYLGVVPKHIRLDAAGVIISTDMQKATDCLNHNWLSWFCLFFNIEPTLLFSEFKVDLDGDLMDYVRGCPMGTPLAWSVLSLTHYMILRSCGAKNFAICGDDAVARLDEQQLHDYKSLLEFVGMAIHPTKTFKSNTHAVFCEAYFALRKDGVTLRRIPIVPMRAFAPSDSDWTYNLRETFRETLDLGVSLRKLNRATKVAFDNVYRACKRYKINPYMPTWAGGMGMPPPNDSMNLTTEELAIRRWVLTHGTSFPVPSARKGNSLKVLSRELSRITFSISTQNPCEHFDRVFGDVRKLAELADCADGSLETRKFSLATIVRGYAARLKLLPRAWGGPMQSLTYLKCGKDELLPSAKSMYEVTGHRCLPEEGNCDPMIDI